MRCQDVFKMPSVANLKGRTSSVTNAFVIGVIPSIKPTEQEIKSVLDTLDMSPDNMRCAYCGATGKVIWDHFRPIVKDKRPTGFISEIYNLIPSCNACNSSKGNKDWREWISGPAEGSPKIQNIKNLDIIIQRLERYEQFTNNKCTKLDFSKIIAADKWQDYWDNHKILLTEMRRLQELSDDIKKDVDRYIERHKT